MAARWDVADRWDVPSRALISEHCSQCGCQLATAPPSEGCGDGRCPNAQCKAPLCRGLVATIHPLRNAVRKHLARVMTGLAQPRVRARHTFSGAAFAGYAAGIWGRRLLGKAWHLGGMLGGKKKKEVVKMRLTREEGLEELLLLELVSNVKGGMGRALLQAGGGLAVCTRLDTTWVRQGTSVLDMEETLIIEYDIFFLTPGRLLKGD